MNLIELLWRISPDGGSGFTELTVVALAVMALAVARRVRRLVR